MTDPSITPADCCVLNAGGGAWAFAPLAEQLARALWVDVTDQLRRFNYLLLADDSVAAACDNCFVSFETMRLAADKRALAAAFSEQSVPTPKTFLASSPDEAMKIAANFPGLEWCLKYPTGCGASGHRMLRPGMALPAGWPTPLVVQEFIRLARPEVYRRYAAGGATFGWVARRFPTGTTPSPWVAHARGARYESAGEAPAAAVTAAEAALRATGLLCTFGCADLLQRPNGEWVVLEVGTDGMFNHVDRDLGLPALELDIQRRIAEAFWDRVGVAHRPWGHQWHLRALR